MEYGITDQGFVVKPFSVILREQQEEFRAYFGEDLDIDDTSITGTYIKNLSLKFAQIWEILGLLYSTCDVDDSFSVYLDRLANLVNVSRLSATKTEVSVCCYGNEGTVIPKGHLIRIEDGAFFENKSEMTISKDNLLVIKLSIKNILEGHNYAFTLNGTSVLYECQSGDSKNDILQGLKDYIDTNIPNLFICTIEDDVLQILSNDGTTPFAYNMISTEGNFIKIETIGSKAIYICRDSGEIVAPIGYVNVIVNPISGLDEVYNFATGITGRSAESDAELRMRLGSRQKQSVANEVAIGNWLLTVPGVTYAKVYSNRTNVVDEYGRPPKSYESVVIGGEPDEIARMIFDKAPAGIEPYGNINIDIEDSNGDPWTIGFSRPVNKYIWLDIKYTLNPEEIAPIDIVSAIKEKIISWAKDNMEVGDDVIYQKLFKPIYSMDGIALVDIKLASTSDLNPPDPSEYETENISIGQVEIAIFDPSLINVEENS